MRQRWLPVGVLAGVLFAVNVVARLVSRFALDADAAMQDRLSLAMFLVIGVVLGAVAFVWGQRRPVERWGGDVALAILVALALTVFVGPFLNGDHPFSNGAGAFFSQVWLYAGFSAAGVFLGYLVLIALGWDHRSQSLKRYAETKLSKPRRVVRR
ncbi:hypothetical protein [Micromonospora sp. NBC_01813]|uniref:hypothetical protein n=1 Tax=Micromonospora sp. NBC_01813 TaxID=2975988 RepID=UPI002DD84AE4|nr:hypothetical protein [Micromonospora sp. NBC_01813]WSA12344.1 hypothetical protein OG958_17075 [Micromonospora sp. NBC_01813]